MKILELVALLAAAAFVGAYYYFNRPRHPKPWFAAPSAPRAPAVARVALERQIELLRDAGLALGPSVTVDDLLHSFPREEYEDDPYALLLIMYGAEIEREPFGRRISAMAWDFDLECIEGPGGYVMIVEELARLTGRPGLITEVTDAKGHSGDIR